jgi:hypothetical protein
MSSERTEYVVQEGAGAWVAGKKVSVGEVLLLSKRQAETEERLGKIKSKALVEAEAKAAEEVAEESKKGSKSGKSADKAGA